MLVLEFFRPSAIISRSFFGSSIVSSDMIFKLVITDNRCKVLLCSYNVVDIILKMPLKTAILSLHCIQVQALKMERSNGEELANLENKL